MISGGYNIANTAKCWTSITAAVLEVSLSENIPEHKVSLSCKFDIIICCHTEFIFPVYAFMMLHINAVHLH